MGHLVGREAMGPEAYACLPYTFIVYEDLGPEGPYWACRVEELPTVGGDGESPQAAIAKAREFLRMYAAHRLAGGHPIPLPARSALMNQTQTTKPRARRAAS
jgi:predicted RNase H-like HicB family nuclease